MASSVGAWARLWARAGESRRRRLGPGVRELWGERAGRSRANRGHAGQRRRALTRKDRKAPAPAGVRALGGARSPLVSAVSLESR